MICTPIFDALSSNIEDDQMDTDIQESGMHKLFVDLQTKEEVAINPSKFISQLTHDQGDSSSKFHESASAASTSAASTSNFTPHTMGD